MKFLLDENFPLAFLRALQDAGFHAEHVILLGWRGAPDAQIIARLDAEELVFFTHDADFERLVVPDSKSQVVISRVPQRLPTAARLALWLGAVRLLSARRPKERLFDISPDGVLVPWDVRAGGVRARRQNIEG